MNRLFQEIQEQIEAGRFGPGQPLPPVSELREEFNASQEELETALSELVYEGYLERVSPEPTEAVEVPSFRLWGTLGGIHSITQEARKKGQEPGTEVLRFDMLPSWPSVGARLELEPGDEVIIMERLRTADGEPIAIETSYLPAKFMPGVSKEMFEAGGAGQSSFAVMQKKYGLKPHRAVDELTVTAIQEREAKLLGMERGTPILLRFRITYSDEGTPIKCSRALWKLKAGYEMSLEK
jgi:GntR family transcriptional regulator